MSIVRRIVSLFSGCLGLDLGLEAIGADTVLYCENDKDCQKIITARRPNVPILSDVHDLDEHTLGDFTMPAAKIHQGQLDQAIADYAGGLSLAEIADHLPITRQALWERFKRAGVKMRPQERHGSDNHFYRGGARGADWAHNKVEAALKRGELVRPDTCSECGGQGPTYRDGRPAIQAHHDDYNKPLDVRWLCQTCHHDWHKTNEPITLAEGVVPKEVPGVDWLVGGFP